MRGFAALVVVVALLVLLAQLFITRDARAGRLRPAWLGAPTRNTRTERNPMTVVNQAVVNRGYGLGQRNPASVGPEHEERTRAAKWNEVVAWACKPGGKY